MMRPLSTDAAPGAGWCRSVSDARMLSGSVGLDFVEGVDAHHNLFRRSDPLQCARWMDQREVRQVCARELTDLDDELLDSETDDFPRFV